jgi:hypothetical protein
MDNLNGSEAIGMDKSKHDAIQRACCMLDEAIDLLDRLGLTVAAALAAQALDEARTFGTTATD